MTGFESFISLPMCGLYSFKRSPEEARNLFDFVEHPDFPPREYVTPGGPMAIVRTIGNGKRHFALVHWGFIPSWVKEVARGKPFINVRCETVMEKPSFRNAIRRRRCLIPADGFYEWEGKEPGKKKPYYIHRPDHGLMAFGGIWEQWIGPDGSELETAAIITTAANGQVAAIHARSPLVIHPQDFERWLGHENEDPRYIMPLLKPQATDYFAMEPTVITRKASPPKPVETRNGSSGQMDLF